MWSGPIGVQETRTSKEFRSNRPCSVSGVEEPESPRVVTVILPEHRGYFVQHLGYFLTTFLLLAFVVVAVIVLTRRRRKRGNAPGRRAREAAAWRSGGSDEMWLFSFLSQSWNTTCAASMSKTQDTHTNKPQTKPQKGTTEAITGHEQQKKKDGTSETAVSVFVLEWLTCVVCRYTRN